MTKFITGTRLTARKYTRVYFDASVVPERRVGRALTAIYNVQPQQTRHDHACSRIPIGAREWTSLG